MIDRRYESMPEHGHERHRLTPAPEWTPDLRRHHVETSIRLSAARLESPFNPDRMARIIEEADLVPQLGGMYFTLIRSDKGEEYARKAIIWALEEAERHGANIGDEVMELAGKKLLKQIA